MCSMCSKFTTKTARWTLRSLWCFHSELWIKCLNVCFSTQESKQKLMATILSELVGNYPLLNPEKFKKAFLMKPCLNKILNYASATLLKGNLSHFPKNFEYFSTNFFTQNCLKNTFLHQIKPIIKSLLQHDSQSSYLEQLTPFLAAFLYGINKHHPRKY